jgi:uncharacterized lipoprotein YbaY
MFVVRRLRATHLAVPLLLAGMLAGCAESSSDAVAPLSEAELKAKAEEQRLAREKAYGKGGTPPVTKGAPGKAKRP